MKGKIADFGSQAVKSKMEYLEPQAQAIRPAPEEAEVEYLFNWASTDLGLGVIRETF